MFIEEAVVHAVHKDNRSWWKAPWILTAVDAPPQVVDETTYQVLRMKHATGYQMVRRGTR